MTTAEKNALKMQVLDTTVAALRHTVRHNGAAISAKANVTEIAEHVLDVNPDRVKTLWMDINTIDRVKDMLYHHKWKNPPKYWGLPRELATMSAEELMEYGVNDERLTSGKHSWAVVKITKKGTEILTCGGNFYQTYKKLDSVIMFSEPMTPVEDPSAYGLEGDAYFLIEGVEPEIGEYYDVRVDTNLIDYNGCIVHLEASDTYSAYGSNANKHFTICLIVKDGNTFVQVTRNDGSAVTDAYIQLCHLPIMTTTEQEGDTDLLAAALNEEDAAWMAETFESEIHSCPTYIEGNTEYICIACELPSNLDQLISISVTRTKIEDDTEADPLEYSLTENSCDVSNEGMVGLPHGMWLIYDNTNLESAPQGLLIPKALAVGTATGFRFDKVKIAYNSLLSGMERLRLVGESFGDEYIVGVIDLDYKMGGTWKE